MKTMHLVITAALLAAPLMAVSSAEAATTFVKFYDDAGNTHGYGNAGDAFSGTGTVYYNMTTPGSGATATPTSCPTVGSCTVDNNTHSSLTFDLAGGLVLTVTASDPNVSGENVWGDFAPDFGGLGVGHDAGGKDTNDNINGTNVLTLTFSSAITLTGVATLFDGAHGPFNADPTSSTLGFFLLNGVATSFTTANDIGLDLTGTTFSFADDGPNDPYFYVSGLAYTAATPLPAALPLFASGLGVVGFAARRRKRKQTLALAAA